MISRFCVNAKLARIDGNKYRSRQPRRVDIAKNNSANDSPSVLENEIPLFKDLNILFGLTQNFDTKKETVMKRFHGHKLKHYVPKYEGLDKKKMRHPWI